MRIGIPALCCLWGALSAQERKPVIGRVVDVAGQPAAAVTVTLVWTPAGSLDDRDTQVIQVATDARGRFIAPAEVATGYTAFAATTVGPDGTFAVSAVCEDVAAGRTLELQLAAPIRSRRVTLHGVEAWGADAGLSLRVASAGRSPLVLPLVDGRTPPVPGPAQAFVVDGRGQVVFACSFPATGDLDVQLPGPDHLEVRIVDGAGKPRAGATVWLHGARRCLPGTELSAFEDDRRQGFWRTAVADAHGIAIVQVPRIDPTRPGVSTLSLLVAGEPGEVAMSSGRLPAGTREQPARVDLVLADHRVLRLRDGGRAVEALFESSGSLPARQRRTSADGRFSWVDPKTGWRDGLFTAWLPGGDRAFADLWALPESAEVDLGAMRRVEIQVEDPMSGRLGGAALAMILPGDARYQRLLWADPLGRVRLRVDRAPWLLLAAGERSLGWLDLSIDGTGESHQSATVRATPLAVAQLGCVDALGVPLADAHVTGVVAAPRNPRVKSALPAALVEAVRRHVELRARALRSDTQGLLAVPFVALEDFKFTVLVTAGAMSAAQIELVALAGATTVTLR